MQSLNKNCQILEIHKEKLISVNKYLVQAKDHHLVEGLAKLVKVLKVKIF